MAGRSRDTYKKRQKEVARAEKRQEKLARRVERKTQPHIPGSGPEMGEAVNLDDDDFEDRSGLLNGVGPAEQH